MPTLVIATNISKDKVPKDFLKKATEKIAERVGKPEKFVCIRLIPDQIMSFGGSDEPCANVDFYCIGKLGDPINTEHSEKIGDFLLENLGIKKNRFYIVFHDLARNDVGYDGKTFAT